MNPSSSSFEPFLGGGPADALLGAARRLRLSFDPQEVLERFEAHADPWSLLAFVDVARALGVEARAFQARPEDLAEAALPSVVHLQDPGGRQAAFALLLERGPDHVVLENPARRRTHRLSLGEFSGIWTGVIVPVKVGARSAGTGDARAAAGGDAARPEAEGRAGSVRAAGAASPRGRLLGGVAAEGAMQGARVAAAVAGVVFAFAAAIREGLARGTAGAVSGLGTAGAVSGVAAGAADAAGGGPGPFLAAALGALGAALVLVGASVCAVLFLASRRSAVPSATPRLASVLCGRGSLTDCEGILKSRFAAFGGIELAAWGLAFFFSTLVVAALGNVVGAEGRARLFAWLGAAFLAASPVSVALIGIQIWPLRRICPLCMTVHAVVLACAALGLPGVLALASPAGAATVGTAAGAAALGSSAGAAAVPAPAASAAHALGSLVTAAAALAPFAALHAVAFAAILGLVIPYLEMAVENRTHRARLHWISATPWGALAELAGRATARLQPLPAKVVLGDAATPFRLDVMAHPTCSGCPPVLSKLEALVSGRPESVHMAIHFPTRDPARPEDRELCVALTALGILTDAELLLRVFGLVKRDPWKRLEAAKGGAARVLAEFLPGDVPLEPALAEARGAVEAADRAFESLKRGTPAVLLNGRPWDAPVEDLEVLLSRHPALLAEILELEPLPRGEAAAAVSQPAPAGTSEGSVSAMAGSPAAEVPAAARTEAPPGAASAQEQVATSPVAPPASSPPERAAAPPGAASAQEQVATSPVAPPASSPPERASVPSAADRGSS